MAYKNTNHAIESVLKKSLKLTAYPKNDRHVFHFKMKLCLHDSKKMAGEPAILKTAYENSTFEKWLFNNRVWYLSNQDFVLSGYYSF